MSPLPSRDRLMEYARKGVHLSLRTFEIAPEQLTARRIRAAQTDAGPGSPRVLFLTPRDWAAHVQWEAMIGQALRLRGAHVEYLTCGGSLEICDRVNTWEGPPVPCGTCTRYVHGSIDAHGFLRSSIRGGWEGIDDPGDWPELDEISARDLAEVVDGELPLGQLVDIPAKWFLLSSQLTDDPLAPVTFRRFLRSARRIARGISQALDRGRPDVVVLLNGLFLFEAIAWAICQRRGIDVVTYERGFIKETLLFRRNALACFGDVSDLWSDWSTVPLDEEEERRLDEYLADRRLGRRTIDRYWTKPQMVAPGGLGPGRLVTLFTNLTWDSAVIGKEVAFPSIQDWLSAAADHFAKRPNDQLIVRIHPAEVKLAGKQTREPLSKFLRGRYPELPPNVRLIGAEDDTSSYTLMEASDLGLVFASTTGLELALTGTPVIVAGSTHYRGKGFTIDVDSPAHFRSSIDRVLEDPAGFRPDVDMARRYAYLFFFRAPVASPGVEEHLPGLAQITIGGLDELRPGVNESVDRICDTILRREAR